MMKLERIEAEIAKTKETISKQQTRLRELEAQKTEVENLQIVQMVRALRMTPAELSTFFNGRQENPLKAAPADTPHTSRHNNHRKHHHFLNLHNSKCCYPCFLFWHLTQTYKPRKSLTEIMRLYS